ncbi:hypothetical protein RPMA_13360 [Tardiphaga alba]|uniref:DUF4175 domain-containing protein n=1 Tax=Tardiphaga alba TaxID=340268 RepID=A0ABX8A7U3_9BRAD|nr:hypothetical protein [Tardiphaga alba]QUS39717.1 hypothetical protein RPMA_13360 [Tardiphaga alba]
MTTRSRQSLMQIFAVPLLLALLSIAGLASALFGDDLWDAVSWLTLGVPLLTGVYFAIRKRS